jgi:UDP-N-acetyl-D-mannosaminouronate:lipid I N-acetyl-D-mannosaminouronosyltransferase
VYGASSARRLIEALREPAILVALNAEKVANADPDVKRVANDHVGYADGMGIVLALRRKGVRSARIAGSDLWLEVLRARGDAKFYLLGSTNEVVTRTARKLRDEHADLAIAGYRDGYFRPDEIDAVIAAIVDARPDVVFVAVGSPRQEKLMERLIAAWPALYLGLGGSFDAYVGRRRRAPRWMQQIGLEWAFRFASDPARLPRLPSYLRFAWRLTTGRL